MDFTEIRYDSDDWELFARDFLSELGFTIESPPDRGPDQGKDLLALESVVGKLHSYTFRWLVSCKHFAQSGKAVNESKDEPNILERMRAFRADGFLGFYSTLPSSGLNTRLCALRSGGDIRDYQIFDHRLIEEHLLRLGFSRILCRYFPKSSKTIRPLHKLISEYLPIACDVCGKDLLEALYRENYKGLVAQVHIPDEQPGIERVEEIYFACKGKCDKQLQKLYWQKYKTSCGWKDLSDLAMPTEFLRWIMATLNRLRSGEYRYTDSAFDKEKHLILALSQKVFREMTERERERVALLVSLPF
ncbi:MAG: restriction endonuclease [Deltaproteobacteria bacterium]|nr:restriction endonuclease [Deltaproteobacteria bacterium]